MPTQQISGTIYQMYDASGNNRRFPVTVVDGVLGLASYLQEQFSSLANLYMPIDYVSYNSTTQVLTVGGVPVDLANLSNYYTKTEADGRFLGINANAASATKLQTARTIWGQDFDGTQDVSGAMTGVTSIDSVINIESGYVGIGKTPSVALDVNGQVKGTQFVSSVTSGAPLVVDSSTLVTNLNADKLDNYDLSDILAMDITGNAKTATNPKSELKTNQEIVFRKTNVTWDAKSGVIKKIKGKTIAWNQQLDNGNFASTSGWKTAGYYGGAMSVSNNIATITLSGTACDTKHGVSIIAGHKYLVKVDVNGIGTFNGRLSGGIATPLFSPSSVNNSWSIKSVIVTAEDNNTGVEVFFTNATASLQLRNFVIVDLTQMFGAGNEPSSVAEFEALYPDAYYPYNPGTLISNDAEAVETTGVNQWDEEWEVGTLNPADGTPAANSDWIRSKNYIRVIPGETYYLVVPITCRVCVYDENKNFISTIAEGRLSTTLVIPENAAYLKFGYYDIDTYSYNGCLNLSNPAINGQYFPYWKRTLQLGITTRKDTDGNVPFADGMKGAGTAADWADKVGGEKRVIRVNLGDLEWEKNPSNVFYSNDAVVSQFKPTSDTAIAANMICSRFSTIAWQDVIGQNNGIGFYTVPNSLVVYDASMASMTTAQFKAAVDGVYLDIELATPVPFTWKEPMPSVYPCDQFGTERVISPVSVNPSAPFCADIQYGAKSDDVANDLIGTRDAVQPLLDALEFDGQNHAWHLKGNLYADGFITAYGINGGARTAVIAPYVIESSNYGTTSMTVSLGTMTEAITKYKQGYIVQAKGTGSSIIYTVTSIDESGSSPILYCNGGNFTVILEA